MHTDADDAVKKNVGNGDTATFSLFNEALNELVHDTSNDESKQIDSPFNSHDKSIESTKNDGKRPSQ